jgi:hypothetical protein
MWEMCASDYSSSDVINGTTVLVEDLINYWRGKSALVRLLSFVSSASHGFWRLYRCPIFSVLGWGLIETQLKKYINLHGCTIAFS